MISVSVSSAVRRSAGPPKSATARPFLVVRQADDDLQADGGSEQQDMQPADRLIRAAGENNSQ
ncbi:hypothetical protein ACU4GA_27060 [Methylobacterium oryzae CBMB20]